MIAQTITEITHSLPASTRLVAVSKFHPASAIEEAYSAGQRVFGESRVQELQQKFALLPSDIEWHFIGHLQTNKVKYIIPYVSLIHSVDSYRLLSEINRLAQQQGRVIRCLLQLHVAKEETKFGFTPDECVSFLATGLWRDLTSVRIVGMMCMATNTDDSSRIERDFSEAEQCFNIVKERFFADDNDFCERSWGMSDDYQIALRHGSTLVRIGTKIFGSRQY